MRLIHRGKDSANKHIKTITVFNSIITANPSNPFEPNLLPQRKQQSVAIPKCANGFLKSKFATESDYCKKRVRERQIDLHFLKWHFI